MWKALRAQLERWGILEPAHDRVTLCGRVRSPLFGPEEADDHRTVLVSVSVDGGQGRMRRLERNGRFQLVLPMDRTVRITFVLQGHLPRMLEVRPLRSTLRLARVRVHARCALDVDLTPRLTANGGPTTPLLERIIMPRHPQPMIVEWDHVLRNEQHREFIPLFLPTG